VVIPSTLHPTHAHAPTQYLPALLPKHDALLSPDRARRITLDSLARVTPKTRGAFQPDRARRITLDSPAVAINDSRLFSAPHPVHARASTPPARVAPKTRRAFRPRLNEPNFAGLACGRPSNAPAVRPRAAKLFVKLFFVIALFDRRRVSNSRRAPCPTRSAHCRFQSIEQVHSQSTASFRKYPFSDIVSRLAHFALCRSRAGRNTVMVERDFLPT
jgi:hypothetical protein